MCAYKLIRTTQYNIKECALEDITSIRLQISKWRIIFNTFDRYWAPSSPKFHVMSRLSPSAGLKWTSVHSDTPLWWGSFLNSHEARRLRHQPNWCLVLSPKILTSKWSNFLVLISPRAQLASFVSEAMTLCSINFMACSKQWGTAYLVGRYLLRSLLCGILGSHFWWLFVPVRDWLWHTSKKLGNRFFRQVAARLPCSLKVGTPAQ